MKIKLTHEINGQQICNICNRLVTSPYRLIVGGRIVEGCVSAAHNGQLPQLTNTSRWHNRKDAKKIRREGSTDV